MKKAEENDWKTEDYWKERERSFNEYVKQNPLNKVKKRVRSRTKKDPITVETSFSRIHPELNGVEMKVVAKPEAWKKIESFALNHPDWFGLEFHSCFANPAVLEIGEKNKPRGKEKGVYRLAGDIKMYAGVLYAFLKYWCRRPLKEWPGYLKKIAEMVKEDEEYRLYAKTKEGDYDPVGLTEYCIFKTYGDVAESLDLDLFSGTENFYVTYIQDQRRPKIIAEHFIKGRTPQEIANLPITIPALNFIFTTLQIL